MIVTQTNLENIHVFRKGKVRDVYELGPYLLLISTDRISAFDVILPTPIPRKGEVLTQISKFWFDYTKDIVKNHMVATKISDYPAELKPYADILSGRSMLGLKCEPVMFECIVRGYITGSGLKEYEKTGSVCGIKLPSGLRNSDRLPEPIFTPSTKADEGHDINVSFEYMVDQIGRDLATQLRDVSIALYKKVSTYAEQRGIILADTKFEFGMLNGELILIDEIFTPDSSRFWPKDQYEPGKNQPSFDKQYVRDWLETLDWDKTYPGPVIPDEVVAGTSAKYQEAYALLTGSAL